MVFIAYLLYLLRVIYLGITGKRYSRSTYIAAVLIEHVLDSCPSGTLIGIYFSWSTYIAISLTEGTYFLTPKGGPPWETIESLSSTTGS